MRTSLQILVAVGILWVPCWSGAGNLPAVPNRYTLTDIGTLGGPFSAAYAVNARGKVVGVSETAQGKKHAFLWQFGLMKDLGTLGGADSFALGMNEQGQVVGWSDAAGNNQHAFLWESGKMTDLGLMGGAFSQAYGINAKGHVVGVAGNTSGYARGFLFADGKMTDLGALSGTHSQALAINATDEIAGFSNFTTEVGDAGYHAVVVKDNKAISLTPEEMRPDPGPSGDPDLRGYVASVGAAINPSGVVAGCENNRAALWGQGQASDLGTLKADGHGLSAAWGINAHGVVVGQSDTDAGRIHAFVWQRGKMRDLNALIVSGSGWELNEARSINEQGQIAGCGTVKGKRHAFLLTLRPAFRNESGGTMVAFDGAGGREVETRRPLGPMPFIDAKILAERRELVAQNAQFARQMISFYGRNLLPIASFSTAPRGVLLVDQGTAIESAPVIVNGLEFRLCTTAVWTAPPSIVASTDGAAPTGTDTSSNVEKPADASPDQADRAINLGFRITNRGQTPRQVDLFDTRTASIMFGGEPVPMNWQRDITAPGLALSPILAPGQTFAFSRLVKLRRIGSMLYLIGSDGFGGGWQMISPVSSGKYTWSFTHANPIFGPDVVHPWWAGTATTPPLEFEIR